LLKIVSAPDEWITDFAPTEECLRSSDADIFTFWQRFPNTKPCFSYTWKGTTSRVLEVGNYAHWWNEQISKKTRNMVRKAAKREIVMKTVGFSDSLARGIVKIYNEKPIRQRRPFRHYGETVEEVTERFSPWIGTSDFAGAYYGDELVGFIHIISTDKYVLLSQIISYESQRDKAVNNALISKAVEICVDKGVRYLIYARMSGGGLGRFKRKNGFMKKLVPRYYIPLSLKGELALALRLHHGVKELLPERVKEVLRPLKEAYDRF